VIVGIGSDLCDIRRIEKALTRFGDRFLNRVFTETERNKAKRRPVMGPTLAKRFAAKEACAKALGTGFSRGVFLSDIGVVNLRSGQPTLELTGGAKARLEQMTPAGHAMVIHLTITDEPPLAQAFVVLEARPLAE
jgi:holo-[acyl-carrier protein] synthase